jgi:hypothetical protein
MGRTRVARAEKTEQPEAIGGGETKVAMVKAALSALGADAKPEAIRQHILTTYHQDLPKSIISNYKSNMKRKNGGLSNGTVGAPRGRRPGGGGSVQLEDLEAVRGLVSRLGAAHVQRLVNLLK